MSGLVSPAVIHSGVDGHSIDRQDALLLRTRFHALRDSLRSCTSSISCSAKAGLSGAGFPSTVGVLGLQHQELHPDPPPSRSGDNCSPEFFCRVPLMSSQS